MTRPRWIVIILFLAAWALGALYLWNTMHRPYQKTQEWTPEQMKVIERAMFKQGPGYTVVNDDGNIYVDIPNGKSWIARGE